MVSGIFFYLRNLMKFGAEYAYQQASYDLQLNYQGLSVVGRDKIIAGLIGFASRD